MLTKSLVHAKLSFLGGVTTQIRNSSHTNNSFNTFSPFTAMSSLFWLYNTSQVLFCCTGRGLLVKIGLRHAKETAGLAAKRALPRTIRIVPACISRCRAPEGPWKDCPPPMTLRASIWHSIPATDCKAGPSARLKSPSRGGLSSLFVVLAAAPLPLTLTPAYRIPFNCNLKIFILFLIRAKCPSFKPLLDHSCLSIASMPSRS